MNIVGLCFVAVTSLVGAWKIGCWIGSAAADVVLRFTDKKDPWADDSTSGMENW